MAKVELRDHQALMVAAQAMKMAPWVVAGLLAEASELIAALESALVEVMVAALERIPVADVVV